MQPFVHRIWGFMLRKGTVDRNDKVTFSTLTKTLNKLAKLRRHVSRVQFTKINFGKKSETRNLKRHMKKHTGKKSYRCFQCDQLFSQLAYLRLHLKSHTGDKPNKCNQCEFASVRPDVLKTHLTTHNGQKSYKCSLCDYASVQAGQLKTHLKTHSGEKLYKCNHWLPVCWFKQAFEETHGRKAKQV